MVLVRKRFFRVHCQTMLANDKLHRAETLAASKMGVEQHAVDRDKITGPINAQLLDHYIPDRVLAESPTISQNTQREAIIGQNSFHRRQTIRARTLGLNTVGLGDRHETRYTIPAPVKPAHTGLGGFPLLSKLGHLLVDTLRLPVRLEHPHTLLTRETTHESKDWSSSVKEHVVSWLPDGFGGLVIGRNSRFFTEELEDERVEQIGGVEYRALRFLSYFVGAVSSSLTKLTSVHLSLPDPPIRRPFDLLLPHQLLVVRLSGLRRCADHDRQPRLVVLLLLRRRLYWSRSIIGGSEHRAFRKLLPPHLGPQLRHATREPRFSDDAADAHLARDQAYA